MFKTCEGRQIWTYGGSAKSSKRYFVEELLF